MIWFTADTHFCHRNAIEHSSRPFSCLEEMHETLVKNWNSRVAKGDLVFHLGDFAITWGKHKAGDALAILSRLKGQKWLIRGNHDRKEIYNSDLWTMVKDYHSYHHGRQQIVMSHYAFQTWHGMHRGSWNLHGHSHGNLTDLGGRKMDVGVDCCGYAPVSVDEVADFMAAREFVAVDHHVEACRD